MKQRMSIRTGLLLVVCAGCPAYLPIDGAGATGSAGHTGTAGEGPGSTDVTGNTGVTGTMGEGSADATTGAAVCIPPTGAPGEVLVGTSLTGLAKAAEEAWGLAVTADRVYVTGQFDGSLRLGGQDLTTAPRPAGVRTFVLGLGVDLSRDADAWVLLSDDEGGH